MSAEKITAQQAAEELQGTCKDIHEVVKSGENDDKAFCEELDNLTQRCDCCGWWVEAYEINDNRHCEDCAGQDEDGEGED